MQIKPVHFSFSYMLVLFYSTGPSWRKGKLSWSPWQVRFRISLRQLPPMLRSRSGPWLPTCRLRCSPCSRTSRSRWRPSSRRWQSRPRPSATKSAVLPKDANVLHHHLFCHGQHLWLAWKCRQKYNSLRCVSVLVNIDIYYLCFESAIKNSEHNFMVPIYYCVYVFHDCVIITVLLYYLTWPAKTLHGDYNLP